MLATRSAIRSGTRCGTNVHGVATRSVRPDIPTAGLGARSGPAVTLRDAFNPGAAAILAYRLILFWLPLILGGAAFASLINGQKRAEPLNVGDRCPCPAVAL